MLPTPSHHNLRAQTPYPPAHQQQQTMMLPPVLHAPDVQHPAQYAVPPASPPAKQRSTRIIAVVIVAVLAIALYVTWHASTTSSTSALATPQNIPQQNLSSAIATTTPMMTASPVDSSNTNGEIQVYIVGAVKHPGVYTLPAGARVYQLLQAAGGPLVHANLVALNMAAKLSDGQEVYVAVVGETPPAYVGQVSSPDSGTTGSTGTGGLVNINTASAEELRQALHISLKSAQEIVDYRLQHGNYTSVNQLAQAVSPYVFKKIKDLVTV